MTAEPLAFMSLTGRFKVKNHKDFPTQIFVLKSVNKFEQTRKIPNDERADDPGHG
jgi:hypothetical protein